MYMYVCMHIYIYITYIYIYIYIYMKGHQMGVEQKGVFEHKQPNFECVCV